MLLDRQPVADGQPAEQERKPGTSSAPNPATSWAGVAVAALNSAPTTDTGTAASTAAAEPASTRPAIRGPAGAGNVRR